MRVTNVNKRIFTLTVNLAILLAEFIAKGRPSSRHIHLFVMTFAFLQIYTKGIGSFTREVNLDLTSTTSTTNLIYLLAYQMCSTYPTITIQIL